MKNSHLFKQSNYLFRTAIEREQKQFIKIAFAVHLSAVISAERYRSDSGALKSAMPHQKLYKDVQFLIISFAYAKLIRLKSPPSMAELILVYFYIIMINKIEQSAAKRYLNKKLSLSKIPTYRTFENRRSRYKELGKKVPQAYRVYVEDTFLPCDAGDARIFSKEEAGLYYYGARYLDPKYSRWLSGDPALNEYIPKAPIDDEAKKHNENLPGMGGVFNVVNLHVYHYAGNNPVKYTDPDGRDIHILTLGGVGAKLIIGGSFNIGIAWDDNGNSALVMTGGFGVGIEAQLHSFITPSYSVTKGKNIDDLPGLGSTRISFSASLTGTEANVGIGIGINFDMESNEISGFNAGIIGGGVNFIGFARFKIINHGEKSRSAEQLKEVIDTIKNLDTIPDNIKQEMLKTIKEMM